MISEFSRAATLCCCTTLGNSFNSPLCHCILLLNCPISSQHLQPILHPMVTQWALFRRAHRGGRPCASCRYVSPTSFRLRKALSSLQQSQIHLPQQFVPLVAAVATWPIIICHVDTGILQLLHAGLRVRISEASFQIKRWLCSMRSCIDICCTMAPMLQYFFLDASSLTPNAYCSSVLCLLCNVARHL